MAAWKNEEAEKLRAVWQRGNDLEQVLKALPGRSLKAIKAKVRQLGLNLQELSRDVIPETTAQAPFVFLKQKKVLFINFPQTGSIAQDGGLSPITSALKLAQAMGYGVVICGGLLWAEAILYQWTVNTPRRVVQLAQNMIDAEFIHYPKLVEQGLSALGIAPRKPEDLLKKGKPVFTNREERFMQMLARLYLLTHDDSGNPYYTGEIALVIGPEEVEMALKFATDRVRELVRREQASVGADIAAIKQVFKDKDLEKAELEDLLGDYSAYLSRVTMSNLDWDTVQQIVNHYIVWMQQQLERILGNATIIGFGKGVIQVAGGDKIKITRVTSATAKREVGMDALGAVKQRVQARLSRGEVDGADIIIAAGANPICEQIAAAAKVVSPITGQAIQRTIPVLSLPPCIRRKGRTHNPVRNLPAQGALEKVYSHEDFSPGVLVVDLGGNLPRYLVFDEALLANPKIFGRGKNPATMLERQKYVYIYFTGDKHSGLRPALIETPQTITLFSKIADQFAQICPISMTFDLGDALQGIIHGSAADEIPEDVMVAPEMEELLAQAREDPTKLERFIMYQLYQRPEPSMQRQFAFWQAASCPELFAAILKRAKRAGLSTTGNLGIVSLVEGNHTRNSAKNIADYTQLMADWITAKVSFLYHNLAGYAQKNIKAPKFGTLGFVWGSLLHRGKEIAFFIGKHEANVSRSSNYMRQMLESFKNLGSQVPHSQCPLIGLAAHGHAGGVLYNYHILLIQAYTAGQISTEFGVDRDFSLARVGVQIAAIPKNGLAWAPRQMVNFFPEHAEKYVWGRLVADIAKLFPNPL